MADRWAVCGILGLVACRGRRPSLDDAAVVRMRDRMSHRGPDGAGLWRCENAVLAHRRLAVIDPTPGGHQPMISPGGRGAIVYNGELYNDSEIRAELGREGVVFRTASDTETVLAALDRWGLDAMRRLRGMYAFGHLDLERGRLTLARDPLGIKPLYYRLAGDVLFASELPAILAHPDVPARPDMACLSAYLTTIRTTTGRRTLFAGVHTVLPGEWIVLDLSGEYPGAQHHDWWRGHGTGGGDLKAVVEDSVARHLRSDVPTCCLLSGGLDSSIIATVARRHDVDLSTYCSGAAESGGGDDFSFARLMAARLGSRHVEAPVTRQKFAARWEQMVSATGLPLSTPNEVAINAVARRLRQDGKIVTLSGEGADELFAGYDGAMTEVTRHVASLSGCEAGQWLDKGGEFQLDSSGWVPRSAKGAILSETALRAAENDAMLVGWYSEEFRRVASQRDDGDPVQAHLRFIRRINLAGLLLRLDSATMLESVEGRTPLADQRVAELAESLPMSEKFRAVAGIAETKIALRRAFAPDLPAEITRREKASFPLPFQDWVADTAGAMRKSAFAREVFSEAAIETVAAQPSRLWQLAWPMINIAIWGQRWWG